MNACPCPAPGADASADRVADRLAAFGRDFLAAFEAMNRVRLCAVAATPMSLSTITFTGVLDARHLPVDSMWLATQIAEAMDAPLDFTLDVDRPAAAKRAKRGTTKRFRCQLPLVRNGKSIKLFHNGSVQATGCTSPLEFLEMAEALEAFVLATADMRVRLVDFDIQLINTLFLVTCPTTGRPMTIAPKALLRSLGDVRADFDTERHPSVKIPIMAGGVKVATACVFQTGSVGVMGAKKPAHVAAAYEMVCRAVDAAAADACAPDPRLTMRTTTAKKPLVLVDGYPCNIRACCSF